MCKTIIHTDAAFQNEMFDVRLPALPDLRRLLRYIATLNEEDLLLRFLHPIYCWSGPENAMELHAQSPAGTIKMADLSLYQGNAYLHTTAENGYAFLHPCFMPYSLKTGEELPITASQFAPGSITMGGTLYRNIGNSSSSGFEAEPFPVIHFPSGAITLAIGDEYETDQQLDFIVYDGMLWSITPLAFLKPAPLWSAFKWNVRTSEGREIPKS